MDETDFDFDIDDDDDLWSGDHVSPVAPFVQRHYRTIFIASAVLLVVALIAGASLVLSGVDEAEKADAPAPVPSQPFSMGPRSPVVEGVISLPTGGEIPPEVPVISSPPVKVRPNTLAIPDLGISAPVVTTDIVGNELVIPDDVRKVTRFSGGARPGDATGTVLLAGHVNSRKMGRGALYPMSKIKPGTTITVVDDAGVEHRYAVVGLVTTGKATLPNDLFSTDGPPRLIIITCGGPLQRTPSGGNSYRDNVIVTALPLPSEQPAGRTAEQAPAEPAPA